MIRLLAASMAALAVATSETVPVEPPESTSTVLPTDAPQGKVDMLYDTFELLHTIYSELLKEPLSKLGAPVLASVPSAEALLGVEVAKEWRQQGAEWLSSSQAVLEPAASEMLDVCSRYTDLAAEALESALPRQRGMIPRSPGSFLLWASYILAVVYVLVRVAFLAGSLLAYLCCCGCCRRDPEVDEPKRPQRPTWLPPSESFLPPLRPDPNDVDTRPVRQRHIPECCMFTNWFGS
ncbi:hypothetical protein AK812_SmicGene7719 [Symbiodinium microadriaticum]|uniref:Uncharacterized protein n=1 Tax=Symbiodinium microadriaticum TaxID=2951 RepID=A0A1Q9EMT3_SYMMI|nr:hypothetical protein AK812_SmicGene7719 [Symbiodinium microadriaticum]